MVASAASPLPPLVRRILVLLGLWLDPHMRTLPSALSTKNGIIVRSANEASRVPSTKYVSETYPAKNTSNESLCGTGHSAATLSIQEGKLLRDWFCKNLTDNFVSDLLPEVTHAHLSHSHMGILSGWSKWDLRLSMGVVCTQEVPSECIFQSSHPVNHPRPRLMRLEAFPPLLRLRDLAFK